ncbi:hypothetical protein C8J56DRAFT_1022526 [Mycena floridula]|nr:hypothetical protein C8J56DRAFT_1022526 [Mycena floridula]
MRAFKQTWLREMPIRLLHPTNPADPRFIIQYLETLDFGVGMKAECLRKALTHLEDITDTKDVFGFEERVVEDTVQSVIFHFSLGCLHSQALVGEYIHDSSPRHHALLFQTTEARTQANNELEVAKPNNINNFYPEPAAYTLNPSKGLEEGRRGCVGSSSMERQLAPRKPPGHQKTLTPNAPQHPVPQHEWVALLDGEGRGFGVAGLGDRATNTKRARQANSIMKLQSSKTMERVRETAGKK